MITLKPIIVAIILLLNYVYANVKNGTEIDLVKYVIEWKYSDWTYSGSTTIMMYNKIPPLQLDMEANHFENISHILPDDLRLHTKTHRIEESEEKMHRTLHDYRVDNVTVVERHLFENRARFEFGRILFPFVLTDAKCVYIVHIEHPKDIRVFYAGKFNTTVEYDSFMITKFTQIEPDIHKSKYSFLFAINNYHKAAAHRTVDFWIPYQQLTDQTYYTWSSAQAYSNYITSWFYNINLIPVLQIYVVPTLTGTFVKSFKGLLLLNNFYLDANAYTNKGTRLRFANAKLAYNIARDYLFHTIAPKNEEAERFTDGIAALLQFWAVDSYRDLRMMRQFGVLYTQCVFRTDADNHILGMITPNSAIVDDNFSQDILIMRYAAIMRMFETVLDRKVFSESLNEFYRKPYDSREKYDVEDFKEAVVRVLGKFVNEEILVTNKWYQPGYPVVTAVFDTDKITFTQQKFTYHRTARIANTESDYYYVPVTFTKSWDFNFELPRPFLLVHDEPVVYYHPSKFKDHFTIVNVKQIGYFRVNYDERNWNRIIAFLSNKNDINKIDIANRAQLIDDAFQVAHAGLLNYTIPLRLTLYLIHEPDFIPWQTAMSNFLILHKHFAAKDTIIYVKKLLRYILPEPLRTLRLDDYYEFTTLNKIKFDAIFEVLCKFDVYNCVRLSQRLLSEWQTSQANRIPRHVREVIYCTAIRNGGAQDWKFLKNKMKEVRNRYTYEYLYMLRALTCTKIPDLLQEIAEDVIEEYDLYFIQEIIKSLGTSSDGKLMVYDVLRRKMQEIVRLIPLKINNIFINILDSLTTEKEALDFATLIDDYALALPSKTLDKTKDKLNEMKARVKTNIPAEMIDALMAVASNLAVPPEPAV